MILLILLMYVSNITSLPDKIILLEGEDLKIKTVLGLRIEMKSTNNPNLSNINHYESIHTSSDTNEEGTNAGKVVLSANLFGAIPVKEINVNVIETAKVVPLGDLVGLKLYTNGVLVVGMSEIEGEDNKIYKPYENCNIQEGDMIIKINEDAVTCTTDLVNIVEKSEGNEMKVTYVREGESLETSITPVKTEDQEYKLGLWVRDAAAGVGTVSFYEPSTGMFASLGHGILDIDTEQLLDIAKGEFVTTNVVSIQKGEKGNPGKIQGSIEKQTEIGTVSKNTNLGVYGKLNNLSALHVDLSKAIDVAIRDEIQTGKATILCTLENNQKKEYEVEIQKLYKNNNTDNKSMLIKVTDSELLEKTGGIIQGMSGAPIMQNGKLVGAVTHVLVSDPTMGYGVFADMMIKQLREVEN